MLILSSLMLALLSLSLLALGLLLSLLLLLKPLEVLHFWQRLIDRTIDWAILKSRTCAGVTRQSNL